MRRPMEGVTFAVSTDDVLHPQRRCTTSLASRSIARTTLACETGAVTGVLRALSEIRGFALALL